MSAVFIMETEIALCILVPFFKYLICVCRGCENIGYFPQTTPQIVVMLRENTAWYYLKLRMRYKKSNRFLLYSMWN